MRYPTPPRRPARPRPPIRVAVNVGEQVITPSFTEEQSFDQYLEQGSFKFERTIPSRVYYDVGVAIPVWRRLHAGVAVSLIDAKGAGHVSAQVPHPFFFSQARTVNGEVEKAPRRETAVHIQASWMRPIPGGLDLTLFGGPTIFNTADVLMTRLEVGLDKEVYPFDTLAFPGAATQTLTETAVGYHAGADVTWRYSRRVGLGALIRYSNAARNFTPTGGKPVKVDRGGLQAGGGLRLVF
jgi:hypothetical protein